MGTNEVQIYKVVGDERIVSFEDIKESMREYYDVDNTEKKIFFKHSTSSHIISSILLMSASPSFKI